MREGGLGRGVARFAPAETRPARHAQLRAFGPLRHEWRALDAADFAEGRYGRFRCRQAFSFPSMTEGWTGRYVRFRHSKPFSACPGQLTRAAARTVGLFRNLTGGSGMDNRLSLVDVPQEGKARGTTIKVIGVGGAGGNAVDNMIESSTSVEFITANTDVQALAATLAPTRLQLGAELTKGLGGGGDPEVGRCSTEESHQEFSHHLAGADMVFITAGMGGGTGTGAAPVIAGIAKALGCLTVAIVTKPFEFEGKRRRTQAEEGVRALRSTTDTLITITNQRLLQVVGSGTTLRDAFKVADNVLRQAVKGIASLIVAPGLINVDFADLQTVMRGMGLAGFAQKVDLAQKVGIPHKKSFADRSEAG